MQERLRSKLSLQTAAVADLLVRGSTELLWPSRCVGCNVPGTLMCDNCARTLPRIERRWACPVCGAPFGWLTCTACKKDWELDGCRCVLSFEDTAARLVSIYKDGHERRLAPIIAKLLLEGLDADNYDAISFVPATRNAYIRRGFDHMEPVCRILSELSGLPMLDVLVREEGLDQRELGRTERARNLEGSVSVLGDVYGMRIVLLDDVVTTGASMRTCARALKARGAIEVFGLALTRVW